MRNEYHASPETLEILDWRKAGKQSNRTGNRKAGTLLKDYIARAEKLSLSSKRAPLAKSSSKCNRRRCEAGEG